MKTVKILLAAGLFAVATSFTFAGPGPQFWTQRRAERAHVAAPTATTLLERACCRVVTTRRPVASHKVSTAVKTVECSGCAAMAAGEKCPAI